MKPNKPKPPVNVNREDLYEQVWKTPLLRLAVGTESAGPGSPKSAAASMCPAPSRVLGKLEAGKPVKQPPLPAAGKGISPHCLDLGDAQTFSASKNGGGYDAFEMETALGNREFFLNKPHGIGGKSENIP
ncbi:MAG: hypothetical protein ABI196_14540 [Bradyrhizobium sp.]